MKDSRIKINVLGITFSQVQAGAYALVMAEENGARRVPIIIGTPEAQSIAIFLEGLQPPRPLTHDLFVTFMEMLHASLKEIFIYKFEEGVFYAKLVFSKDNEEFKIDSRTSDAIALAVRTNAPIYTTENIMQEAGIIMEDDEFEDSDTGYEDDTQQERTLENLSEEELKTCLEDAIANEDYEKASQIRDILNKGKS